MAFKLAVADVVEFDVNFALRDKGKVKQFTFKRVTGDRIPQNKLLDELKNDEQSTADFLMAHITGFESQNMLLDAETDEPVGYSVEALQAMLNVTGVATLTLAAYMKASGAEGKRGN